jgi:hypothetical protein
MWMLSNETRFRQLQGQFESAGIDTSAPGFQDDQRFLALERANPRLMENYAEFVETRSYSNEYLERARRQIMIIARAFGDSVARDGRLGACIDASGYLARMLDHIGVWNYVARSTLTLEFGESTGLGVSYFTSIDIGDRPIVAPHEMVVAPPFVVVDVTARQQPYSGNHRKYVPALILADQYVPNQWQIEDIVSAEMIHLAKVSRRTPHSLISAANKEIMTKLPARVVQHDNVKMKYVPLAVGGFTEQLADVGTSPRSYKFEGRTPLEIFTEDALPALEADGLL